MKTMTEPDTRIVRGSRPGLYDVIEHDTGRVVSKGVTHLQAIADAAYEARRTANGWAPSYEDVGGELYEA